MQALPLVSTDARYGTTRLKNPLTIMEQSPKKFLVIPHDLLDALDDFPFSFKVVYQNYVCLLWNWCLSDEKTGMLSNMLK